MGKEDNDSGSEFGSGCGCAAIIIALAIASNFRLVIELLTKLVERR